MALEEFIAGPYTGTYKKPGGTAKSLGLTEDGFEFQFLPVGQAIEESAEYGGSLLDGVERGHRVTLLLKALSYRRSVLSQVYWQRSSSPLLLTSSTYPVGRLWSTMAGEIVLTGTANTSAAANDAGTSVVTPTPVSNGTAAGGIFGASSILTASLCWLANGQAVAFQASSKLRILPMAFNVLPYADGSGNTIYGVAS